jgi:hypothetical protein
MKIMRVGVDLAKNVFQVHGVDQYDKPVWRHSLKRHQWLAEWEFPSVMEITQPNL